MVSTAFQPNYEKPKEQPEIFFQIQVRAIFSLQSKKQNFTVVMIHRFELHKTMYAIYHPWLFCIISFFLFASIEFPITYIRFIFAKSRSKL